MIETWNSNWVLFTRMHNDHGIPCIYASLRQYIKHFSGSFHVAQIYIERDESTIGASVLEETDQEHECMGFGKWVLYLQEIQRNLITREACSSCFAVLERVLRASSSMLLGSSGSGEEIGAWVRASSLVKKSALGFVLRRGLVKKLACSSCFAVGVAGFVGVW
nr:hypothetical protein CFP56_01786 [Quercus suber]